MLTPNAASLSATFSLSSRCSRFPVHISTKLRCILSTCSSLPINSKVHFIVVSTIVQLYKTARLVKSTYPSRERGIMDPSRLPPELFDMTIHSTARRNDANILCNLLLVSQQWQGVLSGRIYSRWSCDDEYHLILSFWKILRSVLFSKQITNGMHDVNF